MSLLKKLVFLLLLVSFYGSSYAAVDSADFTACGVFSDAEKDKGEKEGDNNDEEEPDCE
jgi:hypothetical protein